MPRKEIYLRGKRTKWALGEHESKERSEMKDYTSGLEIVEEWKNLDGIVGNRKVEYKSLDSLLLMREELKENRIKIY